MVLDIKQNINQIDFELKQLFENVYIAEKVDKNNFFVEITANKLFLFEGCKKRVEVKVNISKNDLRTNIVKWNYSVNPLNENSEKIERVSYMKSISNEIYEIASGKRMLKEYFNSLEAQVDLILECTPPEAGWVAPTEFETRGRFCAFIESVVKKYTEKISNIEQKLETRIDTSFFQASLVPFGSIEYTAEISMADKFRLEKELLESGLVKFVSFNEGVVKVTI